MNLKLSLVIAAHPLCKFEAQEAITAPCCLSPMTLPGSSISSSSKFTERLWVLLVAVSLVDFGSVVAAGLDVERAVLWAG